MDTPIFAAQTAQPARPVAQVRRFTLGKVFIYLFLFGMSAFFLFPLVWMILSSFKPPTDIAAIPLRFDISTFSLDNYEAMLRNVPILSGFKNTLVVVLLKGSLTLVFAPLAAYAFAKLRFRGRQFLFNIVLATLMLPPIVMLIPLLLQMGTLGWINTFQALVLPGAVGAFYIFLMRQQFADVPDELLDAGRVDGCSSFQLYRLIVLPMMRPALAALAILVFLDVYNDFVWPALVINSIDRQTLQVMLSYLYTQINNAAVGTTGSNAWGQVMAASTVATVPLLLVFIFLQRHFIRGIMAGALKG
ncbi:MAG: carbohydrate ABC transporter permease [Chloroflexi bacterium]|nr:carbohydrate ABC transporter permease [Chloroflexota bacterium]